MNTWLLMIVVSILLVLGMIGCFEIGARWRRRDAAMEPGATDVIDAAVFALLGLLLAFQFSAAAARLENRRQIGIQEVNATSTAYARLDLLAEEDQPPLRELFRQYVDTRLRDRRALPDERAAAVEYRQGQKLFAELWTLAVAGCRNRKALPAAGVVLLPALNEVGDVASSHATATATHSPVLVNLFTFTVVLLTALVAGKRAAGQAKRPWGHFLLFAATVGITYYVILDIEYPRTGFVKVNAVDEALVELRQSMD